MCIHRQMGGHINTCLIFHSHPSVFFHLANYWSSAGWSLSQLSLGERQNTPWTGRQSITELTIPTTTFGKNELEGWDGGEDWYACLLYVHISHLVIWSSFPLAARPWGSLEIGISRWGQRFSLPPVRPGCCLTLLKCMHKCELTHRRHTHTHIQAVSKLQMIYSMDGQSSYSKLSKNTNVFTF